MCLLQKTSALMRVTNEDEELVIMNGGWGVGVWAGNVTSISCLSRVTGFCDIAQDVKQNKV